MSLQDSPVGGGAQPASGESVRSGSMSSESGRGVGEGSPLSPCSPVSADDEMNDSFSGGGGDGSSPAQTPEKARVKTDGGPGTPSKGPKPFGKTVGVTRDGKQFVLPETYNSVEILLHWRSLTRPFTLLSFLIFMSTCLPVFCPSRFSRGFTIFQSFFWRLAYNLGLGVLLHFQSKNECFTRFCGKLLESPRFRQYLSSAVAFRDPSIRVYNPDDYPLEYNAWILFRFLVNIILGSDVVAFWVMLLRHLEWPASFGLDDVFLYTFGLLISLFALWSKTDAHRVLGEYAWYWGDFFFLLNSDELVFDGIFSMFPHPMYTVGYFWIYGGAMIAHSYIVLYVSIASHISQMVFLIFFENPHIEKTYRTITEPTPEQVKRDNILYDKHGGFFSRREMILFFNLQLFRTSDMLTAIIMCYICLLGFLPLPASFHFAHAMFWRVLHAILFVSLHFQSRYKSWTRAYEKNGWTKQDAFEGWKRVYNLVLTANHVTFAVFAWSAFRYRSADMDVYLYITQILGGFGLISLNLWCSYSTHEVLSDFGFFYGDFFIDEIPRKLEYSGIYRYLNNPETILGCAAYYGIAMISSSWAVLACAILHHGFISAATYLVEKPHMERVYGANLRPDGGITVEVKKRMRKLKQKQNQWGKDLRDLPSKTRETVELIKMKTEKLKQSAENLRQLPNRAKEKLSSSFASVHSD